MERSQITPLQEAKHYGEASFESAKFIAAAKLSKQSEKSKSLLRRFIRNRTASTMENRVSEEEYLRMADTSSILNGADTSSILNGRSGSSSRKLAVCERSECERHLVYKTMKCYKQINTLSDMSFL